MAISRETTERIRDLLKEHPEGLSITDIVKVIPLNRNTASRYLDTMLVSGQVEMRHFGMAKLYSLSKRLPVSSVLSVSSEYVMQVDNSLRIVFLNAPFLTFLELAERDLVGRKIDTTRLPGIFDEEYQHILRWISEGLAGIERRGEIRLPARERILACRVTPAVFSEGQRGVSILFEDITVQLQDEARLRESEERYRTLVEISPDAIILHRQGIILYANPAAVRLLGASGADDLTGKNILSHVLPEHREAVLRNIKNDLKGEVTPPMELDMLRIDGTPILIEGRGVRTFIDGEPAVQVAMQDITERKRAEVALQKSESRLRSIVRAAPVGIGIVVDRVITEVNDLLCEMTGYTSGELVGQSARMLYPTEEEFYLVGAEKYNQIRLTGRGSVETSWRRKDGTMIDILLSSSPLVPGTPSMGVTFTALDITARKRSEEAQKISSDLYRSLAESATDMIYITDCNGDLVYANALCARILGCSPEELVGRSQNDLFPPEIMREHIACIRQVISTGQPIEHEETIPTPAGTIRIDIRLSPVFSQDGTVVSVVGIARDITGRRPLDTSHGR